MSLKSALIGLLKAYSRRKVTFSFSEIASSPSLFLKIGMDRLEVPLSRFLAHLKDDQGSRIESSSTLFLKKALFAFDRTLPFRFLCLLKRF